jgi:4-diphosphocytidyl-2-C-methyl-D-erythritol kinase
MTLPNKLLEGFNWPAPAKLNLFLHVIGRRTDGYHLLQTVFQFLDYSDQIGFTVRSDGRLVRHCNYSDINPDDDLTIRAARALQTETGCALGVEITVVKQLPMGGGLGGGSSNAATTLIALNQIWSLELSIERLAGIGLSLGADVPVFVRGHAAWAEGIGELLTEIEPVEYWYLVINPGCHVPTAGIFGAPDLTRNTPAITIRDFLKSGGHNDCEPVVRRLYPEVAAVLDWLGQYAGARLTGTGACVFAGFNSKEQAEKIKTSLPSKWQGFVARGLNHSPLLTRLGQEKN